MQRAICILICLAFLGAYGVSVQAQHSFYNISTNDGLSHNTVLCINQDSARRMWFGTYNGLNVYDGAEIRSFRHEVARPNTSLSDNQIAKIEIDHRGRLWVGLFNGTVCRLVDLENGVFKTYSFKHNVRIKLDGENILASDFRNGVYRYSETMDKFVFFSQQKIKTGNSRLRRFFEERYPEGMVLDFFQKQKNKAWVATKHRGIFCLTLNESNQFEIENIVHKNSHPLSLTKNEAYSVFVDKSGILWVGTKDGGVNKHLPQARFLKTLSHNANVTPSLPQNSIRAIWKAKNGELWIGTYNKGVAIYDEETCKYRIFDHQGKKGMKNWDRIRSVYQSSDGYMWVGSYGGLCRIDPETNDKKYYPAGKYGKALSKGRIYSMVEDTNGYLWLGGWSGVDRVELLTGKIEHVLSEELSDEHVRCLYLEDGERLWIGTEFGGINRYALQNGKLNTIKNQWGEKEVLSNNSIFHITKCSDGQYWISTANGITVYDNDLNANTAINEILPSKLVYSVIEDRNRTLWINTTQGIVQYDMKTKHSRFFNDRDGWINIEMCEGAFHMSFDDEIFFGGNNGISFFSPEALEPDTTSAYVSLTKDRGLVSDSCFTPEGKLNCLEVSYFNRKINLQLHAYHYLEPTKNKIAWRLLPIDTTWHSATGAKAELRYDELAPGEYKLQYQASTSDGVWSNLEVCAINVANPFWMQSLFWLSVILFVLTATIVMFRVKMMIQYKKTEQLEALVLERTQKIELQQKLLKNKNEELECFNEELKSNNEDIVRQRDQIKAQHEDLLKLHLQLKEANDMKMQFFSNLAHEFRTPLTLIAGPLEQLLATSEMANEHRHKKLTLAKKQTDLLLKLVNQLLDFKKLEGGFMTLDKQVGELVHFCSDIIGSFEYEAQQKRLSLQFEAETEQLHCLFDAEKLRQLLVNLLSNAFKFTPEGGVIKLILKPDENEKLILLKVQDNGYGIPMGQLEHIFERFYQVQQNQNPTSPGTGLGLAYVKELVHLHDGKIWVESEERKGSCFSVSLPLETGFVRLNEPRQNTDLLSGGDLNASQPNKVVLVVDDHVDMAQYITSILEHKYDVLTAPNGLLAIKMLKQNKVDVVLTDWLMPTMDGLTFCKKIKDNKQWRQIPVIVITALSDSDSELKALESGADDFFCKPFSSKLLMTKIENLVRREKALVESKVINRHLEPEAIKLETEDELISQKLAKIIDESLSSPEFNPESLGEQMGWSKMQLYRKVKQATGMTPNELIQTTRLKRGRQMLENSGVRVNEVGFAVGFNDPKYFSRCFSKAFGLSPSSYKEQRSWMSNEVFC